MKVQLDKTFPMPGSADTAWTLLQNIEGVAGCMPGASITERIDAQHYKGTVAVRFGPANMSFRGEVEVMSLEPASKTLRLVGKGTDSTGSSGASMDLTARVEPIDAVSCNLIGSSEVSVSGKAASFGGRMMSSVADQVLKQFAANFAARVQTLQAEAATAPPGAPSTNPGAPSTNAGAAGSNARAPASAASTPSPKPLNGLALVWAIIKDWLRSLFAAKRA